jgi:hypothetical protein
MRAQRKETVEEKENNKEPRRDRIDQRTEREEIERKLEDNDPETQERWATAKVSPCPRISWRS